jgi:hypothetical protein
MKVMKKGKERKKKRKKKKKNRYPVGDSNPQPHD